MTVHELYTKLAGWNEHVPDLPVCVERVTDGKIEPVIGIAVDLSGRVSSLVIEVGGEPVWRP